MSFWLLVFGTSAVVSFTAGPDFFPFLPFPSFRVPPFQEAPGLAGPAFVGFQRVWVWGVSRFAAACRLVHCKPWNSRRKLNAFLDQSFDALFCYLFVFVGPLSCTGPLTPPQSTNHNPRTTPTYHARKAGSPAEAIIVHRMLATATIFYPLRYDQITNKQP